VLILLVAGAGGCVGKPKPIEVTGSVAFRGQPLTHATIYFKPGTGRTSWSVLDQEGRFRLIYDSRSDNELIYGAPPGKYRVYVRWQPRDPEEQERRSQVLSKEMEDFYLRHGGIAPDSTVEVEVSKSAHEFNFNWN